MKITKQQLIELSACEDGLARFIEQTKNTDELVDVASLVDGVNITSDLVWLAVKTIRDKRVVKFACDCALLNIEKIKPYTDEYDMIVKFLKDRVGGQIGANRVLHSVTQARRRAYDTHTTEVNTNKSVHAANSVEGAVHCFLSPRSIFADNAATYAFYASDCVTTAIDELLIQMFNEF